MSFLSENMTTKFFEEGIALLFDPEYRMIVLGISMFVILFFVRLLFKGLKFFILIIAILAAIYFAIQFFAA